MAAHSAPEKYFQHQWCKSHRGEQEVVLKDGSRADCITYSHAVEFDFHNKWAEAIGQALNYSRQTSLRCGIVIINDDGQGGEHIARVQAIIDQFGLPCDLWVMN